MNLVECYVATCLTILLAHGCSTSHTCTSNNVVKLSLSQLSTTIPAFRYDARIHARAYLKAMTGSDVLFRLERKKLDGEDSEHEFFI